MSFSAAIESASIGGPQLSSLFFLMQSMPSHQITGTLMGFYEEEYTKTDHDTDAVTRRAVITGIEQDKRELSNGNKEEVKLQHHATLGVFTLRRRTSHRLSYKDTQFLTSSSANLLLIVTETETETGLVGTHYTMYHGNSTAATAAAQASPNSVPKFQEIPLHITNLVSTGGDYQNLLRSFTRCPPLSPALEAVAAQQSAALETSSNAMTQAVTDSVQATIHELQGVTQNGNTLWCQVQGNIDIVTAKKENIAKLKIQIQEKREAAARAAAESEAKAAAQQSSWNVGTASAAPTAGADGANNNDDAGEVHHVKQSSMDQFFASK